MRSTTSRSSTYAPALIRFVGGLAVFSRNASTRPSGPVGTTP
jgi:hypothetical protein